jgi:hypothetical protein
MILAATGAIADVARSAHAATIALNIGDVVPFNLDVGKPKNGHLIPFVFNATWVSCLRSDACRKALSVLWTIRLVGIESLSPVGLFGGPTGLTELAFYGVAVDLHASIVHNSRAGVEYIIPLGILGTFSW